MRVSSTYFVLTLASFAAAAPIAAESDSLLDSNTVSKNVVKKPNINIDAVVGAITKAADKLKSTSDTTAKTAVGAAGRPKSSGSGADAGTGAAAKSESLLDSNTVSKSVVKKPNIDIDAVVGAITKAADKLKSTSDTTAKTAVGSAAKVAAGSP
ncbi:hypothetical protein GGI12_001651 [Dipsacomyces acuminosporus]|nr:hypothetical protein GGI12_001651 [Dipsacomyces acuminosporus]